VSWALKASTDWADRVICWEAVPLKDYVGEE